VILRDLDALKRDIDEENAAAADRPLRVGSFEVFTTHFLGSLVGDGLGSRPLTLHELAPGHLEQALAEGQIDLGITYIPIPHADVDHLRVAQVEMGVFRRRGAFSEPAFDQLPFVVPVTPVTGSPDRVRGLDGWPDHLRRRNIRYRVTLMESALELCRQGLAVAFLPRFVVRAHNAKLKPEYRLEPIEIPAGASLGKQAVYLIKRKTDVEDVPMKKLARAIRVGV
jgi:DNA-binding transcriptional LysR family regulator